MADFRQLALEFVLADEQAKLTSLAQQAAAEIQGAAATSNPVARWVESVQPWMPGTNGEDVGEDGEEDTNWTARAKALEFLSHTLQFLSHDTLKPSQVKLLIAFFGAMFEVDHKAGILASATALSRIVAMKAFQPTSGNDIIQKVCALKDDFPRQVSKTRVAIYNLLRSLVTDSAVASDLQYRHGAPSGFMNDLLQLCRNERDPDCLMAWFDLLRFFLAEYTHSPEMGEEVYETFKAYFPITLPRTSPSGITPEDLKLRLRSCFSSDYRLAKSVYPFLIARLDQGDGVTVNVKVDVLRTLKACLEEYQHPEQSVLPFVNEIWGSLKYEVRNGEIEDTIWATLEVLKTLATRLKGDELRDYALMVTRDCVSDLSNTTYTGPAGRLLVSVLSSSPSAFVLMVAPAVTHIKENLRHPKQPAHSQDLLKLLHVILETRILLVGSEMGAQNRSDFGAIDTIFKALWEDVFKGPVGLGCKENASYDDLKLSTYAVQGSGALVCQRPVNALDIPAASGASDIGHLLPEQTCSQICDALFAIVAQAVGDSSRKPGSDELVNETTKALQRALGAFTGGFRPLVDRGMGTMLSNWSAGSADIIHGMAPLLAFVGCSQLPLSFVEGMKHFLYYVQTLLKGLFSAIDGKADPKIWCAFAAGLQSVVRYFNDACLKHNPERDQSLGDISWPSRIVSKYPELAHFGGNATSVASPEVTTTVTTATEVRDDFLLVSLFIVRLLYRRASKQSKNSASRGHGSLERSDDFAPSDADAERRYLYLIASFASFVVHELSESQQQALSIERNAVNLFQEQHVAVPQPLTEEQKASGFEKSVLMNGSGWAWLILGELNVLSFGILESLRQPGIGRLFDCGVAQELLVSGVCGIPVWYGSEEHGSEQHDQRNKLVARSILAILANKYRIETLENLSASLTQGLTQQEGAPGTVDTWSGEAQITSIYAIAAGVLRRYGGKPPQGLLGILREAPRLEGTRGQNLARRLEQIVAPQSFLTKESFATVKPLWMQKVYIELAKPLLQAALEADASDPAKPNLSVAAVVLLRHMSHAIYGEDAAAILRVAIAVERSHGSGEVSLAALQVVRSILAEAPETAESHIRSLIQVCIGVLGAKKEEGGEGAATSAETEAECGKLALEIVGGLPRLFEARHLLPFARGLDRDLAGACGHRVRAVRRAARPARVAWAELK